MNDDLDSILNWITLVIVPFVFALKTLLFRRLTTFGASLAFLAFAIMVDYLTRLAGMVNPVFMSLAWRLPIRILLITAAGGVIWQFHCTYNGWKGIATQAMLGLLDILADLLHIIYCVIHTVCCVVTCAVWFLKGKGLPCLHSCRKRPHLPRH